jgi:hypothetical protein
MLFGKIAFFVVAYTAYPTAIAEKSEIIVIDRDKEKNMFLF